MADPTENLAPKLLPCPTCDGRGKVDSRDKKSWRRFSGIHPDDPDQALIYAGTLFPEPCPACKGTGLIEEASQQSSPPSAPAAEPTKTADPTLTN